MSLVTEFKEFAMKGSVVDMAVGVVIGTAFGKIVSSIVGDVVMPMLGKLLGLCEVIRASDGPRPESGAEGLLDAVEVEGACRGEGRRRITAHVA